MILRDVNWLNGNRISSGIVRAMSVQTVLNFALSADSGGLIYIV